MNNDDKKTERRQFNPLRLAIVVAVVILFSLLNRESNGQEFASHAKSSHQPTPSWTTSFEQATQTARELNQPIMVVFTSNSDWCPWGKRLSKDVFETQTFANWSQDRVVLVEIEYPDQTANLPPALARQNDQLIQKYQEHISGYPTVLFLNLDEEVVGRMGFAPDGPLNWITKAQKYVGKLDKIAQRASYGLFR